VAWRNENGISVMAMKKHREKRININGIEQYVILSIVMAWRAK